MIGANAGDIIGSVHVGVSCQGSVPRSIIAFLESNDYEDAIRNAILLGGDADTIVCIAGGIADAFYGGVPIAISDRPMDLLDEGLQIVVVDFVGKCREILSALNVLMKWPRDRPATSRCAN